MSSPFTTLEEFNGAISGPTKGAIYTFANSTVINHIALLLSVGIFVWFIVRTYATRHHIPKIGRTLTHLSLFFVAGLLSSASVMSSQQPTSRKQVTQAKIQHGISCSRKLNRTITVPTGFTGMLGMISFPFSKRSSTRRRQRRQKNKNL